MSSNPTAGTYRMSYKAKIVRFVKSIYYSLESILVAACLGIIRWVERDSNYIKHAKREFEIMYKDLPPEEMKGPNTWIRDNIVDLLAVLGTQGHSGGSIGYCLRSFENTARFRCLTPLTGADEEWGEPYCAEGSRQNKRMGSIFKEKDGRAYNTNGYVFQEPNGSCFTGKGSRKNVIFPYSYAEPVYIKVDAQGVPLTKADRVLTGRFE